jgi:hypothetical protein
MKAFRKLNLYHIAQPLYNMVKKADITNMPSYDEIPVTEMNTQTLTYMCYKLFVFGHHKASIRKRKVTA